MKLFTPRLRLAALLTALLWCFCSWVLSVQSGPTDWGGYFVCFCLPILATVGLVCEFARGVK